MDDRAHAIEVLKRAREILLDRLTDRVLSSRDDVFEDALGLSYGNEIGSIYEEIGARLAHVNALLENLPAPEAAATTDESLVPVPESAPLALPGPELVAGLLPVTPALTFDLLGVQFQAGDVAGAGHTLVALFDLAPQRAAICARVFHDRFRARPETMRSLLDVRRELALGRGERLLALLGECFDLEPLESVGAIRALKLRLMA